MIGALVGKNIIASSIVDTNINSDIFYTWTKDILIQKIPKKSIIVLDNASFHKRQDIQKEIRKDHHTLLFLPPYSPDLNPIEKKWAHIKSIRKRENLSIQQVYERHIMMN